MTAESSYLNLPPRSESEARSDIKRDTDALDAWRADREREAELGKRGLEQFNQIVELFAPGAGLK